MKISLQKHDPKYDSSWIQSYLCSSVCAYLSVAIWGHAEECVWRVPLRVEGVEEAVGPGIGYGDTPDSSQQRSELHGRRTWGTGRHEPAQRRRKFFKI